MSDLAVQEKGSSVVTFMGEAPRAVGPTPEQIDQARRLSYVQAMLGSIFAASTGGMFLVGYALRLGAANRHIGFLTAVPMFCVVTQLLGAMMVERGLSRRRITIISSILNVSGWPLIILIPFLFGPGPAPYKVWIFIGLSAGLQLFSNISGNARGSWFGDLIPAEARGKFFGRTVMFGGIIGAVFAIVEGLFLDSIKAEGIKAYSWLFAFGAIFGLANALLFVPQADIPLPRHKLSDDFRGMVAGTFANGPFLRMAVYHCVWIMACFAGPFYNTFALRDLKMPFLGLGILNSVGTVTMLLTSGFWGKIVDRYGCRPVLILCTLLISPLPLPWLVLHSVSAAYWVMPWANMISGFA